MTLARIRSGLHVELPLQEGATESWRRARVDGCIVQTANRTAMELLISELPSDLGKDAEQYSSVAEVSDPVEVSIVGGLEAAESEGQSGSVHGSLSSAREKLVTLALNKKERHKQKKRDPWR